MATYTLPPIATTPPGTLGDFYIGSDGRQGGAFPTITINTDNPADLILFAGTSGTQLQGKVTGGSVRLIVINTGSSVMWSIAGLSGQWALLP